ncbi:MAG: hypothetical protein ABSB58_07185 [Gemmatimonadales bacterium]
MGLAASLVLLAPACSNLTTDLSVPVAIEIETPESPFVEVGDTLRLQVRLFDRGGDSIAATDVRLAVIDTAFLAVDSADLAVIGRAPSAAARVVALAGNLRSDPFSIQVPAGHADSLALAGPAATTLLPADSVSGALVVSLIDLTTPPDSVAPLSGRPVRFVIVQPAFRPDTATVGLADDSLAQTVLTDATGTARATLRRRHGTQPDSVVVQAVARRSSGAPLRGSPVQFVVRFP